MTTLAYRNDTLAADTQIGENGGETKMEMQKIFLLDDAIIGIVGDMFLGEAFIRMYKKSRRSGFVRPDELWRDIVTADDIEIIVIQEKKIFLYNYLLVPLEITDVPYYTMGSGAEVAYGAFYMGATSTEAVKAAASKDAGTGFSVVSYSRSDIPLVKRNQRKLEREKKRKINTNGRNKS